MIDENKALDAINPANTPDQQLPKPEISESSEITSTKPATEPGTAPASSALPGYPSVAQIPPATVPAATPTVPSAYGTTSSFGNTQANMPAANPYGYRQYSAPAQQAPASTASTYSTYGTGNTYNTYRSYPQATASTTTMAPTPVQNNVSSQMSYPYAGQQYTTAPPKKSKSIGIIGLVAICIILSLVSGIIGSMIGLGQNNAESTPIEIPFDGNPWADVSGYLLDSTVWVYIEYQFGGSMYGGSGSGVVISSDGYILTNHHVIDAPVSSPYIEVYFYDEDIYEAEIVATDAGNDLALLKIDATGLTPVHIGNSDSVKVGDEVLGIGNQLGEFPDTVTNGIISHLSEKLPYESGYNPVCFQTNLAIMPGNSGGGLFNHQGDLIGINNASYYQLIELPDGRLVTPEISYAITIDQAINLIRSELGPDYISDDATLDIKLTAVSDKSDANQRGYSDVGVYIDEVGDYGPAYFAGLKKDDRIVSVGSKNITTESDYYSAMSNHRVGDYIKITVERGGQQYIYTVQLSRELAG